MGIEITEGISKTARYKMNGISGELLNSRSEIQDFDKRNYDFRLLEKMLKAYEEEGKVSLGSNTITKITHIHYINQDSQHADTHPIHHPLEVSLKWGEFEEIDKLTKFRGRWKMNLEVIPYKKETE